MLDYQNFMEIGEIGSTGFLPSYQILPAFHRTPIGPCILQSSSWPPLTLGLLTQDVPKSTQNPNCFPQNCCIHPILNLKISIKWVKLPCFNHVWVKISPANLQHQVTAKAAGPVPQASPKASSTSRMAGGTSLEVSFFTSLLKLGKKIVEIVDIINNYSKYSSVVATTVSGVYHVYHNDFTIDSCDWSISHISE